MNVQPGSVNVQPGNVNVQPGNHNSYSGNVNSYPGNHKSFPKSFNAETSNVHSGYPNVQPGFSNVHPGRSKAFSSQERYTTENIYQTTDEIYQVTEAFEIPDQAVDSTKDLYPSGSRFYNTKGIPSKQWPPPFPSTDTNADYVFEDYDDVLEPSPDLLPKIDKVNLKPKVDLAPNVDLSSRTKPNCGSHDFKCNLNHCIPPSLVCDGKKDCSNGYDETNCQIYLPQFALKPNSRLTRQEKLKLANVTLAACAKYCSETTLFRCKAFNYRKLDNTCFLLNTNVGLSGGQIIMNHYDYFERKSDTLNCNGLFRCGDNKCVNKTKICDGINDCEDRSDEKYCDADKIGYEVRLAGSKFSHEGRIEVTAFGRTGFVCDDQFGLNDANVVCKELGFAMGAIEIKGHSHFADDIEENGTFYMMDDVLCRGNETSLKDCDFNGWGLHNCVDQEVGFITSYFSFSLSFSFSSLVV